MHGLVKLVTLTVALAAATAVAARQQTPQGGLAPAFTLRDTDGRSVSLASLRGKVVAVNFWATWCAPCRSEIPVLAQVYSARKGACFEMLGLAEESGSAEEVASAARKFGINYPVLLDDDGKVSDDFRITAYPRTFVIDARGRIRKVFEGEVARRDLEKAIDPLLVEAGASCHRS
jgi:cytochrome c biogenesis protein CcmG/thiol:disulfide interchange protein DsbE